MKDRFTDDERERAWIEGERAATISMLNHLLRKIGYGELASLGDDERKVVTLAQAAVMREETLRSLRSICEEFGDNDWEDDLHPEDIIEKHLARHLRG